MTEISERLERYYQKYGDLDQTLDPDFDWDALSDEEYNRLRRLEQEVRYDPENDPSGFSHLRNQAYVQIYYDLSARLIDRPTPTQSELDMGAYEEAIEPQVREAVITLRAKGYNTYSSGFGGTPKSNSKQHISIFSVLPTEITGNLRSAGVTVTTDSDEVYGDSLRLEFKAVSLDLDAIAAKWQEIAALFPDLGAPADEQTIPLANFFRESIKNGESPAKYLYIWLNDHSLTNQELADALVEFLAEHPELKDSV